MSTEKQQVEVGRNYETFNASLPGLLKTDFWSIRTYAKPKSDRLF